MKAGAAANRMAARRLRPCRRLAAALLAAWLPLLAAAPPALAHRRTAGPTDGILIAGISHGEMAILDAHRRAIVARAARKPLTDETFRRVLNYARIQHAFCLWGLAPGSVADEESPFNECSHAYLAAAKDLLVRMRAMPDMDAATRALGERVDRDLLLAGALEVCSYSADTFNTADVIRPRWAQMTVHPPTLMAFGGLAAAGVGMTAAMAWRRRFRWRSLEG